MRYGAGLRFKLRAWVLSGLAICICFNIDAQGVKIGTMGDAPDPSAILDIGGHEKGVLLPRLTQTQRDLISAPASGLMIYQTDAVPGLYIYIGSAWQLLASSSNVWSTAGNGGTDPMTSFIGTTDNGTLHTVSNQVVIGNSAITHNGGFQPWEVYSDARMKFDVRENVVGLDFIKRLRPVTYFRNVDLPAQITGNHPLSDFPDKYNVESIRLTGFLAQEVEVAANACGYDFSGINRPANDKSLYALSYESFVVPLVKAVQEQQAIIESQQSEINEYKKLLQEQRAIIDALREGYVDHEVRLTSMERAKSE